LEQSQIKDGTFSLPKVFVPKLIRRCTEIDPYLQRDFIGTWWGGHGRL